MTSVEIMHFFYETHPVCIFGAHEADRLRLCRRVRDPEELEPFPLQNDHWQAIAAGLRTPTKPVNQDTAEKPRPDQASGGSSFGSMQTSTKRMAGQSTDSAATPE